MAVIRAFRHEVKGHGVRHGTDVDCLYFSFLDTGGQRILQLSTLGSDQRQSQPKVSQTFQIGAQGAAELRRILEQTFPGVGVAAGAAVDVAPPAAVTAAPAGPEPDDPIDRFVARAGLTFVKEVSGGAATARRRVLARDDRPYAGGDWFLLDLTNVETLRYVDVENDLATASAAYQRAAVIVNHLSEDLEQHLVARRADVVRAASLMGAAGRVEPAPRGREVPEVAGTVPAVSVPVPVAAAPAPVSWVEDVLESELYRLQAVRAGRLAPDRAVVRDVVSALVQLGSSGPLATVERAAGLRTGELREKLPLLRRVLNVDGYEALTLHDGVLTLDEELVRQQFGVAVPTPREGSRW